MTTSFDLLDRGYFPEELPPAFFTRTFATKLVNKLSQYQNNGSCAFSTAKTMSYNLFRVGNLRRHISIPNPIFYIELSQELERNWTKLESYVKQSKISKSTPIVGPRRGRALVTSTHQKELLSVRAQVRGRSKYLLKADIGRYYPSIYTHSIPWALHTKSHAKINRGDGLLGNRLDKLVRNLQDGQTIGIPIGPDSSLLLSEIILTAVDQILINRMPNIRGFRYVDDYEFGFMSFGEAEEGLAVLQECLREYELELGSAKTEITDLPRPLDREWVTILRNFNFRSTPKGQFSDIADYFDRAFRFARENPRDSVLNYALARFSNFKCEQNNWNLLQNLIFECLLVEPSTIIKVFSAISKFKKIGFKVNDADFSEILNEIIARNANLGHSSEVAWALWSIIAFNYKINDNAANAISSVSDSVIAILGIDAEKRGLIPDGLNTDKWKDFMSTDELYGEQWLLSYEANIKGWLPSIGKKDHVATDKKFGFLKQLGVEFYNSQRGISAIPTFTSPSSQIAPLFSIPIG